MKKMVKTKPVRIREDLHTRLEALGVTMRPPVTLGALVNFMVNEALPRWERGYFSKGNKK